MKFTPEQIKKARTAKNAEELLTFAKEDGVELTGDEARKRFAELSDNELDNVSGGCGEPEKPIYTAMICDNCGCNTFWDGDYVNGIMYKCNMCAHKTFHGIYTTDYLDW